MLSLFTATIIVLLAIAATRDLASRSIPNVLTSSVLTIGLLLRIGSGQTHPLSLWPAGALLTLLLVLYAHNLLGGGDLKLMTAVSVALTAPDCYRFVIATALFGGLLAVAYLLLGKALPPLRCKSGASRSRRIIAVEAWRIRRGLSLPYGVAIAAGGIFVLLHPTP